MLGTPILGATARAPGSALTAGGLFHELTHAIESVPGFPSPLANQEEIDGITHEKEAKQSFSTKSFRYSNDSSDMRKCVNGDSPAGCGFAAPRFFRVMRVIDKNGRICQHRAMDGCIK